MPRSKIPHPVLVTAVTLRVPLKADTPPGEAGRIALLLIQHLMEQGECGGDTDVSVDANEAGHVRGIEVQNVPVDISRHDAIDRLIQSIREFMENMRGDIGGDRRA